MGQVREAMIVAGGAGTRLLPLTATRPKPLLGFCDAPFLEGVLRRLAEIGVDRVLLVVGADTAPFAPLVDEGRRHGVGVETVPEPEPLDTAGGVRSALDAVSGTFLVLNGDILTDVDLAGAIAAHRRAAAAATLVLARVEDTTTYGVCVRDGTRIVAFVEKPAPGELPGQDTVNAGTYVLEPAALERFPEGSLSFERDVFPGLVEVGARVEGFVGDGVWADLGTPGRFLAGHWAALDGDLRWPTLDDVPAGADGVRRSEGVRVADDAVLRPPLLLLADATIGSRAEVGPHVVVGRDAVVGEAAQVADSVLFDGASVAARAHVSGAILGAGATVGAAAILARGVVVGDRYAVPDGAEPAPGTRLPSGEA